MQGGTVRLNRKQETSNSCVGFLGGRRKTVVDTHLPRNASSISEILFNAKKA
jgi:hypothetical protein